MPVTRSCVNWRRLGLGVVVLAIGAVWRTIGYEGHVFRESGRLPQLRLGDVLTAPLFVVAVVLIALAFGVGLGRRMLGGLLLAVALMYPLLSFPWDGRVVWGRNHHGIHTTDVLAFVPLLASVIVLACVGRRPTGCGGPLSTTPSPPSNRTIESSDPRAR